jgi:hypothetical protein
MRGGRIVAETAIRHNRSFFGDISLGRQLFGREEGTPDWNGV